MTVPVLVSSGTECVPIPVGILVCSMCLLIRLTKTLMWLLFGPVASIAVRCVTPFRSKWSPGITILNIPGPPPLLPSLSGMTLRVTTRLLWLECLSPFPTCINVLDSRVLALGLILLHRHFLVLPQAPGNIMIAVLFLTLLSRMTFTGLLPPAMCPDMSEITLVYYSVPFLGTLRPTALFAGPRILQLALTRENEKLCVPVSVHLNGCSGRLEIQTFRILPLRSNPRRWLYLRLLGLGMSILKFEFLILLNTLKNDARLSV